MNSLFEGQRFIDVCVPKEFKETIATPWASEYIGKLKVLADLDLKHVVFKKDTSKA